MRLQRGTFDANKNASGATGADLKGDGYENPHDDRRRASRARQHCGAFAGNVTRSVDAALVANAARQERADAESAHGRCVARRRAVRHIGQRHAHAATRTRHVAESVAGVAIDRDDKAITRQMFLSTTPAARRRFCGDAVHCPGDPRSPVRPGMRA